jgi:hypothetical protein
VRQKQTKGKNMTEKSENVKRINSAIEVLRKSLKRQKALKRNLLTLDTPTLGLSIKEQQEVIKELCSIAMKINRLEKIFGTEKWEDPQRQKWSRESKRVDELTGVKIRTYLIQGL